jgi:hypothetical protein
MNFNKHSELVEQHAFLSPSKYHWINYDPTKLANSYTKFLAIQKGTELHAFACDCIRLKIKLPKSKKALNSYVNDCIGYRMTPEQPLYYSVNSFGTADAICFREKLLRIHDLKTGVSPVSMSQLEIYAALFCLEYNIKPHDISVELRIYQEDNFIVDIPSPETILEIMEKIILFDKEIERIKIEEEQ